MDRFSSTEEVEFNAHAMSEGRLARMDGHKLADNPYKNQYDPTFENWLYKSWKAGWVDADMDDKAPKSDIF